MWKNVILQQSRKRVLVNVVIRYFSFMKMMLLLLLLLSRFSHVRLCATPETAAHWAPLYLGFSRQEYRSGLPFPSPGDFPDPGIEPWSPAFQADTLTSELPGKPKIGLLLLSHFSCVQLCVTL